MIETQIDKMKMNHTIRGFIVIIKKKKQKEKERTFERVDER